MGSQSSRASLLGYRPYRFLLIAAGFFAMAAGYHLYGPEPAYENLWERPFWSENVWRGEWWTRPVERNGYFRLPYRSVGRLNGVALGADGTLLAAGEYGTILRSTDKGAIWSLVDRKTEYNLKSITIGADGTALAAGDYGTILRSTDKGATWSLVDQKTEYNLRSITIGADGTALAAGEDGTILRSTDKGLSWKLGVKQTEQWLWSITLGSNGTALSVGTGGTILRSIDNGSSWKSVNSKTRETLTSITLGADGTALTAGDNGTILRTTDKGASWKPVDSKSRTLFASISQGTDDIALVAGVDGSIFRSTDKGTTWNPVDSKTRKTLISIALGADGTALVVGLEGTIIKSADGGLSWNPIVNKSRRYLPIVTIGVDGTALAAGDNGTILRSTDKGSSWNLVDSHTSEALTSISLATDGTALAAGRKGTILRSSDKGSSWSPVDSKTRAHFRSISLGSDGTALAAGSEGTILRSTDNGASWNLVNSKLRPDLRSITIGSDGFTLGLSTGSEIMGSTDRGASWSRMVLTQQGYLSAVAMLADGTGLAAGLDATIFRSIDKGASWNPVESNTRADFRSITLGANGIALAVGNRGAIIRSADRGANWNPIESATRANLHSVTLGPDGTSLIVGTDGTFLRSVNNGTSWNFLEYRKYPAPLIWVFWGLSLLFVLIAIMPYSPTKMSNRLADLLLGDQPIDDESLDWIGVNQIAEQLNSLMQNRATLPPMVISIEGEWGKGKSSLMRILQKKASDSGSATVWFNVWHHQEEQNILAYLIEAIREQFLQNGSGVWARTKQVSRECEFRVRLAALRAGSRPVLYGAIALVVSLWVYAIRTNADKIVQILNESNGREASDSIQPFLLPTAGTLGILLLVMLNWNRIKELFATFSKVAGEASSFFSVRPVEAKSQFRENFRGEFRSVVRALGYRRLVIFLDDLDRCPPAGIYSALETINFLTDCGDCFIVLGISRQHVEAGIGFALKDFADAVRPQEVAAGSLAGRHFARSFLKKLIHLSVLVPQVCKESITEALKRQPEPKRDKLSVIGPVLFLFFCLSGLLLFVIQSAEPVRSVAVAVVAKYERAQQEDKEIQCQKQIARYSSLPHGIGKKEFNVKLTDKGCEVSGLLTSAEKADSTPAKKPVNPIGGSRDEKQSVESDDGKRVTASVIADSSWDFGGWVGGCLLLLLVGFGLRLRAIKSLQSKFQDSDEFRDSVSKLSSEILAAAPTPREFKRYMNLLRYLAFGSTSKAASTYSLTEKEIVLFSVSRGEMPGEELLRQMEISNVGLDVRLQMFHEQCQRLGVDPKELLPRGS
jgi:photosystem II stability/assembly factor-like uncharacterized protein